MTNIQDIDLIERIHNFFTKSRLTKKEFARQIGVTEATVHSILNGKQSIKVEMLMKIARVLEVSVSDLILDTKPVEQNENKELIQIYKRIITEVAYVYDELNKKGSLGFHFEYDFEKEKKDVVKFVQNMNRELVDDPKIFSDIKKTQKKPIKKAGH